MHLYRSTKRRGTRAWVDGKGDWSDWRELTDDDKWLSESNGWKHTWTGMPRVKVHGMSGDTVNDTVFKYKVVEDAVSGYKTTYKQFSYSGVGNGEKQEPE